MKSKLPKPLRKQREVLYLPEAGHSVVLGTAGSGKTTLALYRAAYLSAEDMPHTGRTLLLTFNQALVTYLNFLKPPDLRNVTIEAYHKFARGYLNSRGKMGYDDICDPTRKKGLICQAIQNVRQKYKKSAFFDRPLDFFVDEIQWILSHGISTEEDYVAVERVGRVGTSLARRLRSAMYAILQEYTELRRQAGKAYDWDDLAYHVRREFEQDDGERRYRHIVIDEGQDFSPEMLRSLARAAPQDGSLTFFGDVAQQIYGQRTSWRSAGLEIRQTWLFRENYRNTKQIAQLGLAISEMPYFSGIADMVEPTSPKADGEPPTIARCGTREKQIEIALKVAQNASRNGTVAILFRNRRQEQLVSSKMSGSETRLHREMGAWHDRPGIFHGTYHSAKGLEFDTVILPFLDSDDLPDPDHVACFGEDEATTRDGRLLYVAVTRARTRLLLLFSSETTPLLPSESSLYREVTP